MSVFAKLLSLKMYDKLPLLFCKCVARRRSRLKILARPKFNDIYEKLEIVLQRNNFVLLFHN